MEDSLAHAYTQFCASYAHLTRFPWRQGRSNPCNIYAVTGSPDWRDDIPIGSFVTPELARSAVLDHNSFLTDEVLKGSRGGE